MDKQVVRKVSRRRFLEMSALTATTAAIAACAPAPAAPTVASTAVSTGGTLVFGYAQRTSYSDLLAIEQNAGNNNFYLRGLTHEALVGLSADYKWIPQLAESWEFDGNKAIFHLRQDGKWHDGAPFTSKDVLFTWGRLVPHPNVGVWNGLKLIEDYVVGMKEFAEGQADTVTGLSAPDDYTFIVEMLRPYRDALIEQQNQLVIMPEHLLGMIPEEQWKTDAQGLQGLRSTDYAKTQGIGTGPFKVTNYVPDQVVEYAPFDEYYLGKPKLDKLVHVPYTDRLAMAAAVEAGECHVAIRAPETEYERLKTLPNARVVLNPGPSGIAFYHNIRADSALADKRVRQALTLALDRAKIAQDIYAGTVPAAPAQFWWGDYGISPNVEPYYQYNPDRAKQLLEEGGWDFNYTLRLLEDAITPALEPLYAMVREMWAAVGVQSEFQIVGADFNNVMNAGDFDTFYSGYLWGITPAGAVWAFRYPGQGPDDEEGLDIIDEIVLTDDTAKIKEGIWKLQEYAADNPRHTPVVQVPGVHLVSNRVQGTDVKPVYLGTVCTRWIDWVNVYMSA